MTTSDSETYLGIDLSSQKVSFRPIDLVVHNFVNFSMISIPMSFVGVGSMRDM